jgi:AcrR family transcriptional regulator
MTVTRRVRLTATERREQLMAATVQSLAVRGFRDTTAEEIARLAGTSKGLLWHYFEDLDDLFETTARRTLTLLTEAAADSTDLQARVPDVIRSAVRAAAALRLSHGAERRAMREIVQNLRGADGELRFTQADLDELYTAQEAIVRRGQREGDVREDLDPRLFAVAYQGAVDSMLGYLDANPDVDPERSARVVAEILVSGFGTDLHD